MQKLDLQTPDFTAANIARLAELFPNCTTETRLPDGTLKRAIDFDLLRQELSHDLVEGPQERYRLDWPGKREALALANAPVRKTLRPKREESVNFDSTRNLYIEGDNLDALKLLQETYLGQVKVICIDPPYNTGNDFIYDDNFSMSRTEHDRLTGDVDEEGNAMFDGEKWKQNSSSNGRFHSEWLSMIYSRLRLSKNLLRDDGVIFISIDDHEMPNLQKACEEIMGADSLLGVVCNRRRQVADNRNLNRISTDHEYVAIVAKPDFRMLGTPKDLSKYSNPDNDPRGPWMSDNMTGLASREDRPNLHYEIINPETGISYPPHPSRGWAYERKRVAQLIEENRVLWPRKPDGRPRIKRFVRELSEDVTGFSTVQTLGYTTDGTRELTSLFGFKVFDFPKPVSLLRVLVEQAAEPQTSQIILDFFSGSATTAHAVMQLNAEDGGNRRHIMVQLPEPCDEKSEAFKAGYATIAEIGKERIRRAGQKILAEWQAKQSKADSAEGDLLDPPSAIHHPPSPPDIGFRVLKVDSSNFTDVYYQPDELTQNDLSLQVDNLKRGRKPEDLLFQVLLDWGVDLALPVTEEQIDGRRVFFVDGDALAACFETGLDEAFVKALAARAPLRAVFRDAGYANDAVKINIEQIFKALSPHTELKTL